MTTRKHAHGPKGSYPHPHGGYLTTRTHITVDGRRLRITAHHKVEPDTGAIAKALIELAEHLGRDHRSGKDLDKTSWK